MNVVSRNIKREKVINLLYKIINRIENNNNCNPYENGEYAFMEYFFEFFSNYYKNKLVVFDIGANVGSYTKKIIEFIKSNDEIKNYNIHLFEPTNCCFENLLSEFGVEGNIFLNKKALSDFCGKSKIYYDEEKSGLASLYERNLDYYNISLNYDEVIEVMTLHAYISNYDIEHIHLMKLDIEGNEIKALEGMGDYLNKDFVDFIQFEYGGANLDSHTSLADFYELLSDRGFKIAKIMPSKLEYRLYRPEMDNFIYCNYVAISERVLK